MTQGAKQRAGQPGDYGLYQRELAERIGTAFKRYNAARRRGDEITQSELGAMVAKRLGMKEKDAAAQATVSRWMSPTNPITPDNLTLTAIAHVLGVDASWLVLGAVRD